LGYVAVVVAILQFFCRKHRHADNPYRIVQMQRKRNLIKAADKRRKPL